MLPLANRLRLNKDFSRVFKKGRSFFTKSLGVKAIKNDLDVSRFGIVISAKISKKATQRNLLKRRLREILKKELPKIKPGYDFMLITLPGLLEKDYEKLTEEVKKILKQLKAYK